MEAQLKVADQQVLAVIVKLTQKHKLKGSKGGWKEFLNAYDKQMGDRASDPSKRFKDVLVAFLKTFGSQNAREINYNMGWVVTKLSQRPKNMTSTAVLAIDCEMVLCEDGTDACVKVCVVDRNLEVKLNKILNPGKAISEYRTAITGVSAEDLVGVECSLGDVQQSRKAGAGSKYSVFAIFSSVEEANEAFCKLKGMVEKTNSEASDKKRAGETMMAAEPKKPRETKVVESIAVATDHSPEHLKEIERLKRELSEKDHRLRGQCHEHSKEIEVLKEALSNKDLEISALRDTLKKQKGKLKVLKKNIKSIS